MFSAAWDALMRRAERALMDLPYEDAQELVRARTERDWLVTLRREFEDHITTGKMAERQLRHGR